jgi:hypothetical protein
VTAMGGRPLLAGEQRSVTSPAWLIPFDDFRRIRSASGVTAALDIWDGVAWQPTNVVARRTPGGVIAYPGLNFRPWPFEPQPQLYRCRLAAPGRYPLLFTEDGEFQSGLVGAEFVAYPHDHDHPPELPAEPLVVALLPGPAYPFPPGTRVVRGLVRDGSTGLPVVNALVQADGFTDPDVVPWTERALTGPGGAFAIALRFQGVAGPDGEAFNLTATESPDRTGALDIRLTDGPLDPVVVEIS